MIVNNFFAAMDLEPYFLMLSLLKYFLRGKLYPKPPGELYPKPPGELYPKPPGELYPKPPQGA